MGSVPRDSWLRRIATESRACHALLNRGLSTAGVTCLTTDGLVWVCTRHAPRPTHQSRLCRPPTLEIARISRARMGQRGQRPPV